MPKRKMRPFTAEELKIIKENSDETISLRTLSDKLHWNYTNLSTALKQYRVGFKAKKLAHTRSRIEAPNSVMMKIKNKNRELLLTDVHLRDWFKPY